MGQIFCKHIKLNQIADALGVNPEVLAASKNIVGEDMHALFRVFRNHNGKFDTAGNIQFNLSDIALWYEEWKLYQHTLDEAETIKDELDRMKMIKDAEDRFNYWMDIYPRSASLKHKFDDIYNENKKKLNNK